MSEQPGLTGILETVLYCDSSNEVAVRRFYSEVMGFTGMAFDFGYRVGAAGHVFLLFNRDKTKDQERPPPHGASGKGHCCFTAGSGEYEGWKSHLEERGIAWGGEITWGNGMRSFYLEDPAGNVLEIAEGDFWPNAGTEIAQVLQRSQELALRYIESLDRRDVGAATDHETLRAALGKPLPDEPLAPQQVVEELFDAADPGIVATSGGRFFGFVEGGVLPAALGADWLTSTWDQNPGFYVLSPAAATAEEVVAHWLLDLMRLPTDASVGFTTGAQLANVAGLAAGRHHVLKAVGWDVEADGLQGAPPVTVVVGEERHATIGRALRILGLGERNVTVIPADVQGRLEPSALAPVLKRVDGPLIVCSQAGNVNTGAFDPFQEIAELCHEHDGWMHVDGAFGLWAAASPRLKHLTVGVELADSWAVDAHKWLNVPYDSGIVVCAHPDSHRTALALHAPYLIRHGDALRDGSDWTPESSRRARVFAIWAALRSLGRSGVASMIETCCDHAQSFAEQLATHPEIDILNDVVLNQVLVRVGDDDERTRATARRVQAEGRSWLADTVWHGKAAIRISVSDHATRAEDVSEAVGAIVSAAEQKG